MSFSPSISIQPVVGSSNPEMSRSMVDFPEPLTTNQHGRFVRRNFQIGGLERDCVSKTFAGLVKQDHEAALPYRQASQALPGVPSKPGEILFGPGLPSLTRKNNTLNK